MNNRDLNLFIDNELLSGILFIQILFYNFLVVFFQILQQHKLYLCILYMKNARFSIFSIAKNILVQIHSPTIVFQTMNF